MDVWSKKKKYMSVIDKIKETADAARTSSEDMLLHSDTVNISLTYPFFLSHLEALSSWRMWRNNCRMSKYKVMTAMMYSSGEICN